MNKIIFFVVVSLLLLTFFTNSFGKSSKTEAYYKVLTVEHNDNLWNISSRYKHHTVSTKDFICEIVDFNKLDSTSLISGQTLIIPIYD